MKPLALALMLLGLPSIARADAKEWDDVYRGAVDVGAIGGSIPVLATGIGFAIVLGHRQKAELRGASLDVVHVPLDTSEEVRLITAVSLPVAVADMSGPMFVAASSLRAEHALHQEGFVPYAPLWIPGAVAWGFVGADVAWIAVAAVKGSTGHERATIGRHGHAASSADNHRFWTGAITLYTLAYVAGGAQWVVDGVVRGQHPAAASLAMPPLTIGAAF